MHTEPDRIRALPVLATTIGFTLFAAICPWRSWPITSAVGPGLYVAPRPFPAPELQTSPLSDLEKLQSAQLARIERYGWVDQSKGLLRIPIGRAMEIVASKGGAVLEPLEQAPSPQQSAAELAAQAMQKAAAPAKEASSDRNAIPRSTALPCGFGFDSYGHAVRGGLSPNQLREMELRPSLGAALPLDVGFITSGNARLSLKDALGRQTFRPDPRGFQMPLHLRHGAGHRGGRICREPGWKPVGTIISW